MLKKIMVSISLLFFIVGQVVLMPINIVHADTISNITFGTIYTGNISESNTQDKYEIVLNQAGRISINMKAMFNYVNANLKDAAGNNVFSDSTSSGSDENPGLLTESADLEAGTYYLEVSDNSDYIGKYTIQVSFTAANNNDTEPNNTFDTAQPLTLNSNAITGFISWNDDQDIYKIQLSQAGRINLNMKALFNYVNANLKDAAGNNVFSDSTGSGDDENPGLLTESVDLEAGTYYLKVSDNSDYTGKYTLQVNFTAANNNDIEPNNTFDTAQPLALNSNAITGFISWNDDQDIYKIQLSQAGRISLNMKALFNYVNANLKDAAGNNVFSDSTGSGSDENPGLSTESVDLEAGTYYLKISDNSDYTGKYTLQANFTAANSNDAEPNNTFETAQPLALNSDPITGFISWNDDQDIYKVVLPKTEKYIINLSAQFNYVNVNLKDASGNDVFSDSTSSGSDENPGLLSKSVDLEAGTYYLKVSDNTDYTGKYSIQFAEKVITPARYSGLTRFQTAVEISKAGWSTSQNVVLAYAYNFPDALTGVPFAYIKDAPILLTESNSIPKDTSDEIKRLGAKNIYILGGTGVISKNIADQLTGSGYNVYRLAGDDRFETAIQIGNEVMKNNPVKTAVLTTAYNYPDALAISSYAAINKYPILYTSPNNLDSRTMSFIKNNGITNIIIPGGTGAVSDGVATQLRNNGITVDRVYGSDRYDTAYNIVTKYKSSFKNEMMIATGTNFPDALAGGVLAAKKQIPILLTDTNSALDEVKSYIKTNCYGNMYILGGTGVVPDSLVNTMIN